jgi:hypothetical protein
MRAVLNVGYRRGQNIPRFIGGQVVEFPCYCPKVFVLIGDTFDTLRDRAIVVSMFRGEPSKRFVFMEAEATGQMLRSEAHELVESLQSEIQERYGSFKGLKFLTDRDEEIWTPLFVLCSLVCPGRMDELTRAAVDCCAEKTQEARSYLTSLGAEKDAERHEYGIILLRDMLEITKGKKAVSSVEAINLLKEIPTSPWRKYQGRGIEMSDLAILLHSVHNGLGPVAIRVGKQNKGNGQPVVKGYKRSDLLAAHRAIQ